MGVADVSALSRDVTGRYHTRLRETCAELSAGQTVRAIETWWAWLIDQDEFLVPPLRRLDLPTASPMLDPIAPTWAEMDSAINACTTDWHRRLFVLGRCTGLRSGQCLAVEWRDVDLEAGTLRIRPELGKSKAERRGRTVPLAPVLLRELADWHPREARIVPSPASGVDHETLRRVWERAGVRAAAWRQPVHALRKGFKSGLVTLGADWHAVEYLIGHSLGVAGVYTDPAAMPLKEAVALVPEIRRVLVRMRG